MPACHLLSCSFLRYRTARHLLGVWCFTFADMAWYERKIASTLFATPPAATYEEALGHFTAAEAMERDFYKKNTLMIGKALVRLQRAGEAREQLEHVLKMTSHTPEDHACDEEARKLLKSL
jgi:hypothetical protein